MGLEPEYRVTGFDANINNVVISISFMLEAVNASVSIIVYYKMSTKYRSCFLLLFNVDPMKQQAMNTNSTGDSEKPMTLR